MWADILTKQKKGTEFLQMQANLMECLIYLSHDDHACHEDDKKNTKAKAGHHTMTNLSTRCSLATTNSCSEISQSDKQSPLGLLGNMWDPKLGDTSTWPQGVPQNQMDM